MRNVIILGTGGCASEVTFYIEDYNSKPENKSKINILGYIDFEHNRKDYYERYSYKAPILCDIDTYEPGQDEEVLIAVMDLKFRRKMIEALLEKKAKIGTFIHHSVIMPSNANIGVGNIVLPFCILEKHSILGNYNLFTANSFISHDCVVGDNNFFSNAGIAGAVTLGNDNSLGLGSLVLPRIQIGNNNVIQAGMVVDKNIKDNTTIFYRYKEQILAIPKVN